jgi:hypothetical protein
VNPSDAAELLKHCSAFDNRKPSAAAAMAWSSALYDIPFDADARAAVASYYTTSPKDPDGKLWILPHHVRTLRTKIRSARLENFQYEPIEGETAAEFIARYQGQIAAVASGRAAPPSGRPALEGGPSRAFTDELTARGYEVGRPVADSDEQALIDSVRRSGPLGVICPACNAAVGRPCKIPGGSAKQPMGKTRLKPHNVRLRVVSGESELTPEQRAAEEQRRREASAASLARMEAEAEIVDAEIVETGDAS